MQGIQLDHCPRTCNDGNRHSSRRQDSEWSFSGWFAGVDRWSRRRSREGLLFESLQFLQFFGAGLALSDLAAKLHETRGPPLGLGGLLPRLAGLLPRLGGLPDGLNALRLQLLESRKLSTVRMINDHFRSREVKTDLQTWADEPIHRTDPTQNLPLTDERHQKIGIRIVQVTFLDPRF